MSCKICWFDTTDSTWSTQFPVLPHVDWYLKSQIFKDTAFYGKRFRTGRVFTDYFDELYHSGEKDAVYELPDMTLLHEKLGISWNSCFENYKRSRFGLLAKIRQHVRSWIPLSERFRPIFVAPASERPVDVSCRLGFTYDRPSVIAHRRAIAAEAAARGVATGKIPLNAYFDEMSRAKIGVSPFGVGEITLRDYEIILCGCALLKPDMAHLVTWPELFVPGVTFQPHRWDVSDFNDKLDTLLRNPALRTALAEKAAAKYYSALSEKGMKEFVDRILARIAC